MCQNNASITWISNALTYENLRHSNQCYLTYLTYGHTIEKTFARLTQPSVGDDPSLAWKLSKTVIVNGGKTSVIAGTGQSHQSRLYGAMEWSTSSPKSSTACLTHSEMETLEGLAQDILDIEDPVLNSNVYFIYANLSSWWGGNNGNKGCHFFNAKRVREMGAQHMPCC